MPWDSNPVFLTQEQRVFTRAWPKGIFILDASPVMATFTTTPNQKFRLTTKLESQIQLVDTSTSSSSSTTAMTNGAASLKTIDGKSRLDGDFDDIAGLIRELRSSGKLSWTSVFSVHNQSCVKLVEIDLMLPSLTASEVSLAHNVGWCNKSSSDRLSRMLVGGLNNNRPALHGL